ncbi:MAG: Asp-tRNA(Asn)/Glu-tRNA(Gln) amidotransferase subunit GatC [Candidatus Thorarchaeota archaeon]
MSEKEEFSKEKLDHLSKLALLDLAEEEKEKLANELNKILEYFKIINEIDTEDIEPMTHPIEGLKNVFREDIPWKSLTNEEVLKNTQHKKDGYFKAPRILKD